MQMHTRLAVVLLSWLLAAGGVHAQGRAEVDYDRLLSDVESAATLVDGELTELTGALQATINSQAEMDARFEKLTKMLAQVKDKIGEQSDNWRLVEQAIQQADTERQANLDKYAKNGDADYQGFANHWADMKKRLTDVRQGLLNERTDMDSLATELERSRDKITQLLKLKRADAATKKLESVRDRLTAMNQTMRTLVESTKSVQASLPN